MMLARRYVPIQNIGLYVPGGTASLVSTLMMMLVPAKIAGNPNVIVCTPPNKGFKIDSAILYICRLFGVKNIYKIGGAQAIGLMAYGSSVTPKCNKIFGPGNAFVTEAKKYIAANTSCAIDMPAGPSEVFVIGDETANAEFIASDLLSQAEHDVNARAICISHSQKLLHEVNIAVAEQMKSLSRKTILGFSNIVFINTKSIEESLEYSNREAPEHLILSVKDPEQYLDKIVNAGSIFLGNYTPESLGDYTSGTNHVLPTNGCAAGYSGLGLDAFYKSISVQKADKEVLQKIADDTITLANHEGLDAHANAIKIRCKN
jgi:histidinol dehydrogenase